MEKKTLNPAEYDLKKISEYITNLCNLSEKNEHPVIKSNVKKN